MLPSNPPAIVADQAVERASALSLKANRLHGGVLAAEANALDHALACGQALVELRECLPLDWTWDAWREKHLEFSLTTAREYERLAREWDRVKPAYDAGECGSMRAALKILTPAKTARPAPLSPTDPVSQTEKSTEDVDFQRRAVGKHPEESVIPAPVRQPLDHPQTENLAPAASMGQRQDAQPIRPAQASLPPKAFVSGAEVDALRAEIARLRDGAALLAAEKDREIAFLRAERSRMQAESEALRHANDQLSAEVQRLTEAASKKKGKSEPKASEASIPPELDTVAFRSAWARWVKHRSEIKKALKPTQIEAQLEDFVQMGEARAIAAIKYTIKKGWQGLVEPDETVGRNGSAHSTNGKPSLKDRIAQMCEGEDL